jgi:hypothetical protein
VSPALKDFNRYALKEWAVVVEALLAGRQILLFRKGGIREEAGVFRLAHSEFFFFPTYLHEHREKIVPDAVPLMERALVHRPAEQQVDLPGCALVKGVYWTDEMERLRRLRPYHILSDAEVEKRFHYRDVPGLFVILLRVYELPGRPSLPVLPSYAGCRSWVDLRVDLSTNGCIPVLTDGDDASQIDKMKTVLQAVSG